MSTPLVAPLAQQPNPGDRLTAGQRVALWADLWDASEEMLLTGLRRELGPDGDLITAYRDWCEKQKEEHDRMIRRMAQRFYERGVRHGR